MKDKIGLIVLGVFVLGMVGIVIFAPENDTEIYTSNSNEVAEEYQLSMNQLTVDEFIEAMDSKGANVLYIMNTGCGYCTMFSPIIDSIVAEYDLNAGYLNFASIASQEEYDRFMASHEYFASSFGTPTTMLFVDGELIDVISGYVEEETAIGFFRDNNIIE